MPVAKIEVRRSRPPEEVQGLIEAVYLSLREALKVPDGGNLGRAGVPASEIELG